MLPTCRVYLLAFWTRVMILHHRLTCNMIMHCRYTYNTMVHLRYTCNMMWHLRHRCYIMMHRKHCASFRQHKERWVDSFEVLVFSRDGYSIGEYAPCNE